MVNKTKTHGLIFLSGLIVFGSTFLHAADSVESDVVSNDSAAGGTLEEVAPRFEEVASELEEAGSASSATDEPAYPVEQNCGDKIDNDNDALIDCADADCYSSPECKSSGGAEATDALCSDFIDNDNDGYKDCDDKDCQVSTVSVCRGSWDRQAASRSSSRSSTIPLVPARGDTSSALKPGMDVEELIGTNGDADGERNNIMCADGIDNDGDGMTDCDDVGCRFDPMVTVCRGVPGLRFSLVSHVSAELKHQRDYAGSVVPAPSNYLGTPADFFSDGSADVRFSALQLRVFGPMPGIQDSFFFISTRMEKTPRLTFAMAQFPIKNGHFFGVNSGGGGLSNALIRSVAKRALIDPPFYLYSAFEQGNGAAIEFNGPIIPGTMDYRLFLAGGAGVFNGNVGGRFFSFDNNNFTYSAGGQLTLSPIGYYNRWDTEYLYVPVPTTLGINIGARWDQRSQERFPAVNISSVLRAGRFIGALEGYGKRELNFDSWQGAYNVMVGGLLIPKYLFVAADVGQFISTDMKNPPAVFQTDLRRQRDTFQYRLGLHVYVWKNLGVLSAIFTDNFEGPGPNNDGDPNTNERSVKLVGQFRF